MADESLPAHSLAEAHLYLLARPCGSCGQGPVRGERTVSKKQDTTCGGSTVEIHGFCATCGTEIVVCFRLSEEMTKSVDTQPAVVNPTVEQSRILDLADWLTLFRMITEAASRETNRIQARQLGIEAALCLEEGLKFFEDEDNDLPSAKAFFSESSLHRFRQNPEQFSKQRLLELRSKLPTMAAMRSALERPERRSWWRRSR
ncbi:MAG: hypothetical protein AABZ47_12135 [Planctomycetota bacterium]